MATDKPIVQGFEKQPLEVILKLEGTPIPVIKLQKVSMYNVYKPCILYILDFFLNSIFSITIYIIIYHI